MRKKIIALMAAIVITGTIAFSMFAVSVNAMANQNGTTASNSPGSITTPASSTASSDQAQIAQLQSLVTQYQAREQQYQTALNNDNAQLSQAASQMQMIQQLMAYLQNHGLIQIDNQGQIYITGR